MAWIAKASIKFSKPPASRGECIERGIKIIKANETICSFGMMVGASGAIGSIIDINVSVTKTANYLVAALFCKVRQQRDHAEVQRA